MLAVGLTYPSLFALLSKVDGKCTQQPPEYMQEHRLSILLTDMSLSSSIKPPKHLLSFPWQITLMSNMRLVLFQVNPVAGCLGFLLSSLKCKEHNGVSIEGIPKTSYTTKVNTLIVSDLKILVIY